MTEQIVVTAGSIGICDCGAIISLDDLPRDPKSAKLICPECDGALTDETFGLQRADGMVEKVKWVNPDGVWTKTEPTETFDLGRFFVIPDGLIKG